MSDDPTIDVLLSKRAELATQLQEAQVAIFHIDATLVLLGHKMAKPRGPNRFAPGELVKLVGVAERAGCTTNRTVAEHIMRAKDMDTEDRPLAAKITMSVKDCRKRLGGRD
jgi:hypothetical protein